MSYHIMAFIAGFVLDLFLGDPHSFPHPVKWMGKLIAVLTRKLLKERDDGKTKKRNGLILVLLVLFCTIFTSALLLIISYKLHPYFGVVIEAVMTYQCLAAKSLYKESMKVYDALHIGVEEGRRAVSMIVGRDTAQLDERGVIKAAVETVAENTSDGVIAPMMYLALGGPVLGMAYKAINTMDSMIGYKNDQFMDFGRYGAKLDDIVNFLPSRISAIFMILACGILGKEYSLKNAFRIFKRDRYNHKSPNSAQTESVCAGALEIQLAGPTPYFGEMVEKPFIGDGIRSIELEDIKRANCLMITTAILWEVVCVGLLALWL